MKQTTIRRCQIIVAGKTLTIPKGYVFEAAKLHTHAEAIGEVEGEKVNFITATEDELLAAKWKVKDAREYLKTLDVKLKTGKREDMVAQILDARYRAADIVEEPSAKRSM